MKLGGVVGGGVGDNTSTEGELDRRRRGQAPPTPGLTGGRRRSRSGECVYPAETGQSPEDGEAGLSHGHPEDRPGRANLGEMGSDLT